MNLSCLPVVALFGGLISMGDAFTLDAAGYEGGALARDPFSVLIPGYGEVVFETETGAPLVVDPAYANGIRFGGSPLIFEPDDLVKVGFPPPSGDGMPPAAAGFPPQYAQSVFQGGDDASGLQANVWNAIPEPASAGLGLVGVVALLLGRRR